MLVKHMEPTYRILIGRSHGFEVPGARPAMSSLSEMKCETCRVDAPRVTESEMTDLLRDLPDWQVITHHGVPRIERVYAFRDFAEAVRFTNQVAALAEEAGHHPSLLTEWGRVTVGWWTHKIKGLHRNDFILAARTDALYQSHTGSGE